MTSAYAHALSAALLHFVWQGLFIAFLLWVGLFLLRKQSANSRYLASCAGLAVMAAMPIITASILYESPATGRVSDPPGAASLLPAAGVASGPLPAPPVWLAAWQSWALPMWSLGVLLFSVRLVWGCKQVRSLQRRSAAAEGAVIGAVAALGQRLGLSRPVGVLIAAAADGPSVVGWIRPVVLLPSATVLGLTPEQLEAVLAHELAHIRRHDYVVNLAQNLVETLLFYHPAVWWVSARIRHERELCCDDLAVRSCGNALCYARALTQLERLRLSAPDLAMAGTGGPLLYRIQRLIGLRTQECGPSKLSGILALGLGLACFAVNVHWARGQSQEAHKPPAFVFLRVNTREGDSPGVSVDLGGAPVIHRPSLEYPGPALEKGIQGTLAVEVTLDARGDVSDARILSGPAELRRYVLQSVLEWHFLAEGNGSVRQIQVAFDAGVAAQHREPEQRVAVAFTGNPEEREAQGRIDELNREIQIENELTDHRNQEIQTQVREIEEQVLELQRRPSQESAVQLRALEAQMAELRARIEESRAQIAEVSERAARAVGRKLARIDIEGFSNEVRQALLSRVPVHLGDILNERSLEQIAEALRNFDEHHEFQAGATLEELDGGDFALRIVAPNRR